MKRNVLLGLLLAVVTLVAVLWAGPAAHGCYVCHASDGRR